MCAALELSAFMVLIVLRLVTADHPNVEEIGTVVSFKKILIAERTPFAFCFFARIS